MPLKFALLTAILCSLPSSPSVTQVSCGGCVGAGASGSASGGTCGGSVGITVVVMKGKCKWIGDPGTGDIYCGKKDPCTPSVTRNWMDLPPNSDLEFCVTVGQETLCLDEPPDAGASGSGEDTRESAPLACGASTTFSVKNPRCGLIASASANCSSCEESGE